MTGGNQATTCSKLSSVRWQTEIQANQEKAGVTPHTLQERRPQSKDTQQNIQSAYMQQAEQQQESLSGEERETGLEGATGWREIPEPTLQGTQTLNPDPFSVTSYGDEECRKARTSITPREHQERTHLYGGDWRQAERTN